MKFTAYREHTTSQLHKPISKAAYVNNIWLLRDANYATHIIQGGSNMTGTDLYVNKPHCAAAVRP